MSLRESKSMNEGALTIPGYKSGGWNYRLYTESGLIDPDKLMITANYPLKMAGGGHPVALDTANKRVFIGCRQEPMVVVMDAETGKEITGVPVPQDIDDLFYYTKNKRLYASCGEGFIAVLQQMDADHYEVVEKIATVKGAKTSLLDAEAGRLYLAVPRQAGQPGPEIRIYKIRD